MVNAEKNYENFLLEKIFKISDILVQVSMRESDIKEVINYMSEVHPNMEAQFKCLPLNKTREVIENITIEIYE